MESNKLELKHLASYFQHGVLVWSVKDDKKGVLSRINYGEKDSSLVLYNHGYFKVNIKNTKLVLKPLSMFDKWIIKDIKSFLDINHNQCIEFLNFADGKINLENISLGLYNAMCSKHLDFQGLIPQGLAIDINTLK